MQDMTIKGTGNSRYLKSIANILTLYPNYESFAAALAAGTFPIDLNGINSAGIQTAGTALNKASLLSDDTAAAAGGATTPDQALRASPPPGSIFWFGSITIPTGYLKCDGAVVSRADYPKLFAAIGTKFGAGNGSTTFALPNLVDYFVRGTITNSEVGTKKDGTKIGTTTAYGTYYESSGGSIPVVSITNGESFTYSSLSLGDTYNHGWVYSNIPSARVYPSHIKLVPIIRY